MISGCRILMLMMLLIGCRGTNEYSAEEASIRKGAESYEAAFNRRDAQAVAAAFAPDATYIDFSNRLSIQGREDISAFLQAQKAYAPALTLKITVNDVSVRDPSNAVVKGKLVATTAPDAAEEVAFKAECVKDADVWQIKKIYTLELEVAPSNYEQLKELEWLVGKWADRERNVTSISSFKWGKNRNFLVQRFKTKILDQKELSGWQIIGWDPIEERIHSWIFDSDGGVGKSIWTHQDNSWFLRTSFTLHDGLKASATHVITKIDDNTYTFSSESRDVNGRLLPNIGPFKVVRE